MAKDQLEAFLTGGNPEDVAATVAAEPPGEPTGEVEAEAKVAEPDGAKRPDTEDDDREPPAPLEGQPVISRRAYEDERRKRQDWKERAARAEAERDLYRRQVEEAQQRAIPAAAPQPSPQPPPQLPPIDIVANPQGFVERVQQVFAHERTQLEQKMLNDRLNMSEERLRDKIGDKVDEYVKEFQVFAQRDPSLWGKLYSQANPYGWLQREIDRQRLHRDVGDDPEAFKARLRAEWEAEQAANAGGTNGGGGGNGAAPPRAMPRMAPSLANVRSVAGRTDVGFSGAPSLDDILARPQTKH